MLGLFANIVKLPRGVCPPRTLALLLHLYLLIFTKLVLDPQRVFSSASSDPVERAELSQSALAWRTATDNEHGDPVVPLVATAGCGHQL